MTPLTRALCLAACSWLALACSSDDSEQAVPRGPLDFAIGSVATVSESISASGKSLVVDCTEPLLVSILPKLDSDGKLGGDFLLAPPGDCGSTVDCGWIVLTVFDSSGDEIKASAAASVLPTLRVDLPGETRNGTVTFHAELRDANGETVLTETDDALAAEFDVALSTSEDCP